GEGTDGENAQGNELSERRPPNRGGQAARDGAEPAIVDPAKVRPPNRGGQATRDGAEPAIVDPAKVRQKYEEAVQNALGFKQGVYSATEFPGIQGIFINNLMSDDSPAALANIQGADLLTTF